MKKITKYIFILAAVSSLASCNKWLDIQPEDTTTEKQLFSNAGGYHAAINGMYQTMASPSLYGENLTWGFVSALGQNYDNYDVNDSKKFSYAEKYEYEKQNVKRIGEDIWQTAYNVIANANNLLQHLETADPSIFPEYDKCEVDVIKGEALAIRALMHFEVLRLFGESPAVDANAKSIPYEDKFPSVFSERQTVTGALSRIKTDLEEASTLLAKNDTTDLGLNTMFSVTNRYHASNQGRNIFFTARGTRLNYVSCRALLARVLSYEGETEKAAEIANGLLKKYVEEEGWYSFTNEFSGNDSYSWTHKMMEELLVSFYSENLYTVFEEAAYKELDENSYALKSVDKVFKDNDDNRKKLIKKIDTETSVTLKFTARKESREIDVTENRIIPIMRISELYLIAAEDLAKKGDNAGAAKVLNTLRTQRKCIDNKIPEDVTSDELNAAIETEFYREYLAEGQYFFFCKKNNAKSIINGGTTVMTGKYTMPIPDSQTSIN